MTQHSTATTTRQAKRRGKQARANIRAGGRVVGVVRGDTFHKRVQASRHFLKRPAAIAFDVASLREAEAAGAEKVEVTDRETGTVYRAAIGTVWERGWSFNRGYGEQVALALGQWNRDDEPVGQQLTLFGAGA